MRVRGQKIGQYCRSSVTAAQIGKVIYNEIQKDIVDKMKQDSPISLILGKEFAFLEHFFIKHLRILISLIDEVTKANTQRCR